jgi:molybdate transport system regulatory protein
MRQTRQKLHPSFKIWLSAKGEYIIGKGGVSLLRGIQKYGSITKAAKELGRSYNFAWNQLRDMEKKLGAPVVLRKRGGATGGGAELTELARTLLRKYETLEKRIEKTTKRKFCLYPSSP